MSLMRIAILAASATVACGRSAFVVDDGCGDAPCPKQNVETTEPAFPRLAATSTGNPQVYDAGFQQWASKHSIAVIGGDWEGWARDKNKSRDSVVSGIKNQSTVGTRVLQSVWLDDYDPTGVDAALPSFRSAIADNNWFLWAQGNAGTHVLSAEHPSYWQLNMAEFCAADANGEQLEAAFARFIDDQFRTGGTANAAAHLDGFIQPMTSLVPLGSSAGDYNRDGVTDNATSQQSMDWWQTGVRSYFDWFHTHWPAALVGGGGTNWGNAAQHYASSMAGAENIHIAAGAIGFDYSIETTGSTADLVDSLLWTSTLLQPPGYLVVKHELLSATGSDPYSPGYQAMRYGLCLTLMTDGFYAAEDIGSDTEHHWFDELAVSTATGQALTFPNVDAGLGYLGQPSGDHQVLANGVYRRDFEHGIALMNPKGNGTRTVALETEFRKIAGSQAPSINDGSTAVTSVTLQARDGLILLR